MELWYWNIRGLAERIRLVMEYVGIKYVNKSFESRDQWFKDMKPTLKTSFPNLPFLKDGDNIITES